MLRVVTYSCCDMAWNSPLLAPDAQTYIECLIQYCPEYAKLVAAYKDGQMIRVLCISRLQLPWVSMPEGSQKLVDIAQSCCRHELALTSKCVYAAGSLQ